MHKLSTRAADLKALLNFVTDPKEKRAALEGIHITDKYIEASNGRGLLRVNREMVSTDAPAGVYKVIGQNKLGAGLVEAIIEALDVVYPNTDQVIPAAGNVADQIKIPIYSGRGHELSTSSAIIKLFKLTGNGYALELIKSLAPVAAEWIASKAAQDKCVRLDHKCGDVEYIAVLMPFKL